MTVHDLQRLYDYGDWANQKLLATIAQMSPAEFVQSLAGRSIRNTLVHMLSAEWGWLSRCGGLERGPALNPDDYPTIEILVETWRRVESAMRGFLCELNDGDLTREVTFRNPEGQARSMPLGELLQHAAIHGVHHRGQVSLMLRMRGHNPDNFDLLFYDAEKRGVPAW